MPIMAKKLMLFMTRAAHIKQLSKLHQENIDTHAANHFALICSET